MNVPFVPVRGLLGTDYMKVRPDFRAVPNPYDPREEIALVPSIAPDVAVSDILTTAPDLAAFAFGGGGPA